jgi:hypothetical protein
MHPNGSAPVGAFTNNAGSGNAVTCTVSTVTGGIKLTFSSAYIRAIVIGAFPFTLSTTAPS